MQSKEVKFFKVGNGNCSLVTIDEFSIVFDLCHIDGGKTSYEFLKPQLRNEDGKYYIDVLFISHGDKDHCEGFEDFKQAMDNEELVIGAIMHPGYDRKKDVADSELPESYKALDEEIKCRRDSSSEEYGSIEIPLKAGDSEEILSNKIHGLPDCINFKCLNPHEEDDGQEGDTDPNEQSLVVNLQIDDLSILFTGDSGHKAWQERIIPFLEENGNFAESCILVCSHHGSYSFFGDNREDVLKANPYPDNYEALNYISPQVMVISAGEEFPLNGDSPQEQPPHYAAYKWYKKWFVENREVDDSKEHPVEFKYTCDGHLVLKKNGGSWEWDDGWKPPNGDDNRFQHRGGSTKRNSGRYA